MSSELYGQPRHVERLEDCYFYHSMDIPGYGVVTGDWDLRADTASYLGNVPLQDKRVIEVGPASGYLSFWMEKQGASVVSVDVSPEFRFDVVPFAGLDRKSLSDGFVGLQDKVQNGYWLTHRAVGSKNRVHYGSGYAIPQELGQFQIGVMASVLLHNSNPLMIMDQVARLTTEKLIVADLCHESTTPALPTIQLYPSAENQIWHTWWRFSEAFFIEAVKILGFPNVQVNRSTQYYQGHAFTLHTIVGSRS